MLTLPPSIAHLRSLRYATLEPWHITVLVPVMSCSLPSLSHTHCTIPVKIFVHTTYLPILVSTILTEGLFSPHIAMHPDGLCHVCMSVPPPVLSVSLYLLLCLACQPPWLHLYLCLLCCLHAFCSGNNNLCLILRFIGVVCKALYSTSCKSVLVQISRHLALVKVAVFVVHVGSCCSHGVAVGQGVIWAEVTCSVQHLVMISEILFWKDFHLS